MKLKKGHDLILKKLVVGPMEVNCYIVADPVTKNACLIDPGADPDRIKNLLDREKLDLKFILNTHGHGDHIAANGYFNSPIYIHRLDSDFLMDIEKNLSNMFGFPIISPKATKLLEDKDKIYLSGFELEVIHTPGHTPGSISIKLDDIIFTGDALFHDGIGRTDFSYGDERILIKSIKEKLLVFNDDTIIYPGHGESSTIGEEKNSNPFLI